MEGYYLFFVEMRQKMHEIGGFYRSRVFTSGNKRDIFFNVNSKKAKCLQSNDECVSARKYA